MMSNFNAYEIVNMIYDLTGRVTGEVYFLLVIIPIKEYNIN